MVIYRALCSHNSYIFLCMILGQLQINPEWLISVCDEQVLITFYIVQYTVQSVDKEGVCAYN